MTVTLPFPTPSARSSHFIPMWTHMHPMVYIATLRMHVCVALVRHLAELFLDSFAADPTSGGRHQCTTQRGTHETPADLVVNISWARSAIMTGALSVARARWEGCMSFGTSTSDPIACALHVPTVLYLLYVSAVDTIHWRSGCSRHCTLEKRPSWRRGSVYIRFCTVPPHITGLFSAAMASSTSWPLVWDLGLAEP